MYIEENLMCDLEVLNSVSYLTVEHMVKCGDAPAEFFIDMQDNFLKLADVHTTEKAVVPSFNTLATLANNIEVRDRIENTNTPQMPEISAKEAIASIFALLVTEIMPIDINELAIDEIEPTIADKMHSIVLRSNLSGINPRTVTKFAAIALSNNTNALRIETASRENMLRYEVSALQGDTLHAIANNVWEFEQQIAKYFIAIAALCAELVQKYTL